MPCAPSTVRTEKIEVRYVTHNIRTINWASTSKTSDATRLRDAGVARRARAAPCRTRRIEPMMMTPTSTRFAWRVAYVIFASVTGDG